jgi:hypothetical protein
MWFGRRVIRPAPSYAIGAVVIVIGPIVESLIRLLARSVGSYCNGCLVAARAAWNDEGSMSDFSPEYRAAIEESLKKFVNNGDDVACIGYYVFRYGNCQMCPKEGIRWHYVLENLRTHSWLIVGSECVDNYCVILSEWGYTPQHIFFPNFLRPYSRWLLEKMPEAVVFDDGVVMRFQVDCGTIIKAKNASGDVEHYRYAKRTVVGGGERIVGVDEVGRQFPVGPRSDWDSDAQYASAWDDAEEEWWDLCDCGVEPSYCPDCDNEMCLECGAGCTCDGYEDEDDEDEDDRWE